MNTNHTFILAPIRGITNFIYRNALKNHFGGVDHALAPYIVPEANKNLNQRQLNDIKQSINKLSIEGQVLTKDANLFFKVALIFKDYGVKSINLNMGCPYPMVANRMKGSGLLGNPELVRTLLKEISSKCPLDFSVKLRLGRENPKEVEKIIPILNDFNIKSTIHPRIGKQLYKGNVDLDSFERYLPLFNQTPCYNGDINTISDYLILKEKFPQINSWMIGRGALYNPALFSQIKGQKYTRDEYKNKFSNMHEEISHGYLSLDNGKSDFLNKMKGQWVYMSHVFSQSHKVMKKIKKAKSVDHYNDAVKWIFDQEINQEAYGPLIH